MTISITQSIIIILVVAACTFLTRLFPFALFGGNKPVPKMVQYIGGVLPRAVIAILIVYCLKGIQLFDSPNGLPEFISVIIVAGLHIWKRNNLLSIGVGTICYMFLVQVVFK